MSGTSPQVDAPESKRRKVRKGTQNCWECRRRKVRCIFATTSAVCENCKRRGSVCLSQELAEEPTMPSTSSNPIEARLGRVERLIEHLVDSDYSAGIPTPASSEVETGTSHVLNTGQSNLPRPTLKRPSAATTISPVHGRYIAGKYEELSHALIAVWPSQHDMDLICKLPVGLSAHLHGGICAPYSSSMDWDPPSPQEMLKLPPPGSHPVLIARKLLVLGTFIQGVLPSAIDELADLGACDIMSRVVESAIRLVTTNEDLIRSVEGIECIMIEAEYQNYAGNLHRAWMAMRRATTVAQMMALHRGLNSPSLKFLTPEMRAIFNPDQICFRLVEMDRYLSLMLGLPCTSLEVRFATPESLEGCQPIDRMQRIHCTLADRILQRNENNFSETHDIDTLLQKAAAEMPPQWWLIPDLSASNMGGTEVLHETIRLMDQFSHYHLLIRLHLPYMLRSSPDHRYDHSKITAVTVSRETLVRFVAFRTSNPAHFYCRGTDFLAFISTTVLCLAHLDSRSRSQGLGQNSNPGAVFSFLAHSRPSDRGIMERTLEILESMARAGTDAISSKISRILRHLLAIEANAASGTSYNTNSSRGDEEELECYGKLTSGGKGLHVHIPYFGTINFERGAISKSVSTAPTAPEQRLLATLGADTLVPNRQGQHNQLLLSSPDYLPANQVDGPLDYNSDPTTEINIDQLTPPEQLPPPGNSVSSFSNGNIQEDQLPLFGAEDDWDLQGVDVALFDSLFRGTAIPDAVEEENWAQWAGTA
ncbi:hypothetical protein BU16DRAFT_562229 [Lophium mytilinum]|uniref:Zn(2)-C6 fungal-type domain-containing protein n=1 Tax=Lophium mytilinum TaxID=390894 RepID=A0A6A6QQ81_9PEZI|nr:hypothetical protein BU16DRAFT_562229 [Lophium mytilinum]